MTSFPSGALEKVQWAKGRCHDRLLEALEVHRGDFWQRIPDETLQLESALSVRRVLRCKVEAVDDPSRYLSTVYFSWRYNGEGEVEDTEGQESTPTVRFTRDSGVRGR